MATIMISWWWQLINSVLQWWRCWKTWLRWSWSEKEYSEQISSSKPNQIKPNQTNQTYSLSFSITEPESLAEKVLKNYILWEPSVDTSRSWKGHQRKYTRRRKEIFWSHGRGVPEIKYFASGQFKVNTALFSGSQSSLLINHSTISDWWWSSTNSHL